MLSREEETLRLKLDIDRDHPDQNQGNEYPFPWRPATGNLMYLMPSKGSRVSLYFKNGDESSATAVNCIRQEGEGAEKGYRKRSLRTEHQKELKLYPDRMGVISPEAHVLLDDLEGLSVRGVATAVGAGAGATMLMEATAVGGTTFVAGLAVTDLISRRVSSTEEYMKAALAGSVVGALTGAAELVPVSGLARVGVDFLAGGSGSAAGQLITEEEIDAERMFREGVLAAVMAAGARMLRGGNDKLFDYADERLEDIPSSVWNDGSFPRGKRIDKAKAIRNNLGDYFPTVDRLSGKVLSSNKSHDTTLPSYLNAKKWLSTMKRDINKLNRFTQKRWAGKKVSLTSYDVKQLNIVLPNVELTSAQKTSLNNLKTYAKTLKIEVKVYITK